MAASSSTLVRNKSLSPPVICKHEIQTTTTIDNNLEDLINLFISLIIDRNNSNELTSITTLEHLITSPQFNKVLLFYFSCLLLFHIFLSI
jgi:hypothetical protein